MSTKPLMTELLALTLFLLATPTSAAAKELSALETPPSPRLERPLYSLCVVDAVEYGCLDMQQAKQLSRVYAHYRLLHTQLTLSADAISMLKKSNAELQRALDAQAQATQGVVLELNVVKKRRDDALERATRAEAFHVRRFIPWIIAGGVATFAGGVILGVRWSRAQP